jgi:hypothetical protein
MFPTSRVAATLAAALLVTLATTAVTAQETVLQNDSFISGQPAGFQAGFAAGEIAASRFLPSGSPSYIVKRIQLLFGGATTSQAITLRIWNDAASTTVPGAELFSGDFLLTGSNTALQEIDLVSSNVIVAGQFRVGIEFQHDGLPSVAKDADGTIQATKNFIFAQALGWTQSNLLGLNGDWVIRAVVGSATPPSASLADLTLSAGTLVPPFASGTFGYSATVVSNSNTITVTPTAASAGATITVNGIAVTSGMASGPITLNPGGNQILVVVTSQDGMTTQTYTVNVSFVLASSCTYLLSPIDLSNTAAAGASPSITVTTPSGCPVIATSFQPWVTVNSITPNGSTTTVALTVSANAGAARATAIVVAGRLYLITQLNP